MRIGADDVQDLCTGSVFLATGGGGDPYIGQLLVTQALKRHGAVDLLPLAELPDDALVVAIGEVGAPSISLEQLPIGDECLQVVDRFEAWTGRQVTHIVSFEVGGANSVIPLITAAAKGIPLLDGDGMGRALPEAQMMTFSIEGVSPGPALAVDYSGGCTYFDVQDAELYERQVRNIAMAMGGMVFTAEHPMTAEQARRAVIPGTLSFAREVGRTLRENRGNYSEVITPLRSLFRDSIYGEFRLLYSGKVTDIQRRTVGGFDVGEAVLESTAGPQEPMRLSIKNEFLLATVGDQVVASVPDLITMVDQETSTPINSERLHFGQRVAVFAIGCPPHYRSDKALQVVAPRAFGFDLDYVPLEDLPDRYPIS